MRHSQFRCVKDYNENCNDHVTTNPPDGYNQHHCVSLSSGGYPIPYYRNKWRTASCGWLEEVVCEMDGI